jgi:hypothetical protein
MSHVSRWLSAVASLSALATLAGIATDSPGLVVAAIWAVVMALLWLVYVSVSAARAIRERTASWRAVDRSELARVRAQRPHAQEGDGLYAATEYAVAVGTDGDLVTWAFTPLRSDERPARGHVLITGTPRYSANPVDWTAYDASDTARAAEQLVDAQTQAASWETEASLDAAKVRARMEAATELAIESGSTGEALRRITGQTPR